MKSVLVSLETSISQKFTDSPIYFLNIPLLLGLKNVAFLKSSLLLFAFSSLLAFFQSQ